MEALNACVSPSPRSFLEESEAGMPSRRHLSEIRRLKLLSTSGSFSDGVKKQSRIRNTSHLCSICFGGEVLSTADPAYAIEIELHSKSLYPSRRLVRSVSTPTPWKGGLFCTCNISKFYISTNSSTTNDTSVVTSDAEPMVKDSKGQMPIDMPESKTQATVGPLAGDDTSVATSDSEPKPQDSKGEMTVNMSESEKQTSVGPFDGDESNGACKGVSVASPETATATAANVSVNVAAEETKEQEIVPQSRPSKSVALPRANSESVSLLLKDSCPPHGTISIIGRRREMEDAVAAVPSFFCLPKSMALLQNSLTGFAAPAPTPLHFFGVYDGHGGSQASSYCKNHFHEALAKELRDASSFSGDLSSWSKVMSACFMKMDMAVGGMCPNGGCSIGDVQTCGNCCQDPVAPENVGSTAVIAVVSPSEVVIANCGDSRAVLSRGGKAIALSNDHKPEQEDEMGRIEAAGGRVIFWNGYRVAGFLAMSRALGDRFLKRYVISEPEVTCTERTHEDECLILASDGLWDVLSNDTVCEVARKCLAGYRPHRSKGITEDTPVGTAAAFLTKLALGRGSGDNISVVVIDLKEQRSRNR
ncbi:hypothetical protein SUGI_1150050 [Cryptomeria japonica]|uniref:probable protein phosphatase 2C 8 n=1 Tax=Cryptomeria japonica TaxID=3369 RepID=UPI00241471E1|nr:probable protein phosphatase 2C 8 [Cryptomeria japonica]XP_057864269.2 probable protein phosphatase 2C 8 [Cryptomeria japonica]XP_057864278.2 probable protein phosphatase 2C 8 [Cryptomeria japonica]XP_057864287.2 probable protein phosphatase 2C 8 [Cryptomeria japonica]XP_057864296.2 probable protein phosphatase 2C 8 [Cryptomeria japonica]XP_057864305.2 probable protein phosphatase 2C 8 [Cryptomeria japonica]GLJ53859.1 hypothetical protein SUGI_1150050 [Cryptomeria japonica]